MASVASWLPFARASAIGWVPIAKTRLPGAINFNRRGVDGSGQLAPVTPGQTRRDSRRRSVLKDCTATSSTAAKKAIRGATTETSTGNGGGIECDLGDKDVGDRNVDNIAEEDLACGGIFGRSMSMTSGGQVTEDRSMTSGGQVTEDRVCFNVSGQRFETWPQTLQKYPDTLLGSDEKDYFFDMSTSEVSLVFETKKLTGQSSNLELLPLINSVPI